MLRLVHQLRQRGESVYELSVGDRVYNGGTVPSAFAITGSACYPMIIPVAVPNVTLDINSCVSPCLLVIICSWHSKTF